MQTPFAVSASPARQQAIEAIDDLLARLRMEHVFVAGAARSAWLNERFDDGPVDVLALMAPQSRQQVPMMAMNRGFEVDRAAVEAADELDVVPLGLRSDAELVRVHVLIASNALYAMMIRRAVETTLGERKLLVVGAEDLALLLVVSDESASRDSVRRLVENAGSAFDVERWNERLTSIGLSHRTLS